MIQVEISNRQSTHQVETTLLNQAVHCVLHAGQVAHATISLCLVDDETIHELNRQYLDHDYPTDVLSFVYEPDPLEGEIVVSVERAYQTCGEFGWDGASELLLYVIHGALHLVGYLDDTPERKREMRQKETEILGQLGVSRPTDDPTANAPS